MIPPVGWYVSSDADRTVSSKPDLAQHLHRPELEVPARGWIAVPAWRSTTSDGTPS